LNAAKKIILLLWLVIVASLGNVSALTPGATENRVWQKSFAVLESRQAEPLQTPGLHQENESCGYELAPESLLAAKGGVGPVLQGQAGVARAIGEYEAAGGQVLGREISLRAGGGLTRPDFYGQSAQGFREFIEVKNGASAALNPNQARLFPIVQQSGAVPVGANAARAGLPPGVPIPPTHVRVITYP